MIVIVGAGLAGLAAAHRFMQSNYLDFVILEAQDFVGGRVRSIQLSDGVRLDLGAQWLHGHKQNPIYEWLESLDCIDKLEEDEAEFEGVFVTSDGERAPSHLVSKTLEVLLDTKNDLYRYAHLASKTSRPIDMFRSSLRGAISDLPVLSASDRDIVMLVQSWFELYETIDNSCESLEQLSIRAYSGWKDFDDGKMVRLKGGWQRVVNEMETVVGKRRILLNSQVEGIRQQEDGTLRVSIIDRDPIACDHVILTQSVKALKKNIHDRKSFFPPELKHKRSSSITKLGFGSVNKIFLQFAEPYLQEEKGLKVLHRNSPKNISKSQKSDLDCTAEWTRGVLSFEIVHGAPNVLLVWVGGVEAAHMEQVSDRELGETLLNLLAVCLPERPPPRLISVFRSAWSSNPNIGGAYSYPSFECTEEDMKNLWDPICDNDAVPRILFAGEATAGDMYATAHGAIISGWREADRILKRVNCNRRTQIQLKHIE